MWASLKLGVRGIAITHSRLSLIVVPPIPCQRAHRSYAAEAHPLIILVATANSLSVLSKNARSIFFILRGLNAIMSLIDFAFAVSTWNLSLETTAAKRNDDSNNKRDGVH